MRVIGIKRVVTIINGVASGPASSESLRIYIIQQAEDKGMRMHKARDTTQSRVQRYAYTKHACTCLVVALLE